MEKENFKKIDLFELLVRPMVRFAVKHGIHFQEASQIMKRCFVEEANAHLQENKIKVNASRLSAVTGLQRKDLEKIKSTDTESTKTGLASKIVGRWIFSKKYLNADGQPKVLKYDGANSEFANLVREVSADLHPGTILFELERMKLVQKNNNEITLISKVIEIGKEPVEAFKLVSSNYKDLLNAVEHNISIQDNSKPNLHASTEFTKIDVQHLDKVRNWLLYEGSAFQKKAREYLARYDLDLNPTENNVGVRVCLVTFSSIDMEVQNNGKN